MHAVECCRLECKYLPAHTLSLLQVEWHQILYPPTGSYSTIMLVKCYSVGKHRALLASMLTAQNDLQQGAEPVNVSLLPTACQVHVNLRVPAHIAYN